MVELAELRVQEILTFLKPFAVFLVVYCFLFVALGTIFRSERKARFVVSVIIAAYSTNAILANGWDQLIVTSISATVGAVVRTILVSLAKYHKTGGQDAVR